jgi:hypothetical protein
MSGVAKRKAKTPSSPRKRNASIKRARKPAGDTRETERMTEAEMRADFERLLGRIDAKIAEGRVKWDELLTKLRSR